MSDQTPDTAATGTPAPAPTQPAQFSVDALAEKVAELLAARLPPAPPWHDDRIEAFKARDAAKEGKREAEARAKAAEEAAARARAEAKAEVELRYSVRDTLRESGCVDPDAALKLHPELLAASDDEARKAALEAIRAQRAYLFPAPAPATPPAPAGRPSTPVAPKANGGKHTVIPTEALELARRHGIDPKYLEMAAQSAGG